MIYQITLAFDAEYESDVILTLTLYPTRYPIPSEGKNYNIGQKLQKIEIIRVIYQITLDFDAEYESDVILTLTLNPTRYPILN